MTADMQVRLGQLEAQVRALASGSGAQHGEQLVKDASTTLAAAAELEARFTELWRRLNEHPTTMWLRLEKLERELKELRAALTPELRAAPALLEQLQKGHADLSESVLEHARALNHLTIDTAPTLKPLPLVEDRALAELVSNGDAPEPEPPKPPE